MILHKIQEGVCPFCGEDDLNRDIVDAGMDGNDYYFYKCQCGKCNRIYTEWYELSFKDIQLEDTDVFVAKGKEGFEYKED